MKNIIQSVLSIFAFIGEWIREARIRRAILNDLALKAQAQKEQADAIETSMDTPSDPSVVLDSLRSTGQP
jgi:hypothetical protein